MNHMTIRPANKAWLKLTHDMCHTKFPYSCISYFGSLINASSVVEFWRVFFSTFATVIFTENFLFIYRIDFIRKMHTLFTGGASVEPKPRKPLTYSQIRLKYCGERKIDERVLTTTAPKYSNEVLIGNWYEERVPPVFESTHWTTDYRLNYVPHKVKDLKAEMYETWKKKQKAQRGEQELSDDEDSDMKSKYRYRDHSTQNRENLSPPMKSSYQTNFVGKITLPDSNEQRFPKNRLDMNTPDLRHLGIDLSKSRAPAREPQYRRVGTKRMCTWL